MGSESYQRDCYDLCYSRGLIQGFADIEESQDEMEAREKDNERTTNLSDMSKTLCKALKKNDALVSGINRGTHHLLQATDGRASLALLKRPLASGPSRPDTDVEEAIVRTRLDSAYHLAKVLVDSSKHINQAILQTNIDSAGSSQKSTVQEPTIFYRVCHENSYTSHDVDLGFWSARGLPDHNFCDPLKSEFHAHVDYNSDSVNIDNKLRRITFKSPYISLTTDPGRALNIGQRDKKNWLGGLQHEVYQIDAAKLRRMKIDIESTVDIAERLRIPYRGQGNRLPFVTDSHWVANFWIPAECIIGKLPFSDFEDLCKKHGIVFDGNINKVTLGRDLPPGDFERKCESLRWRPAPPIQVEILHDSDDEPTTSLNLPSPIAPNKSLADDDSEYEVGNALALTQNTAPIDPAIEAGFRALSVSDT